MIKKIILFCMVLSLLMTSTISSFAMGNDYTLTPVWYDAVLDSTEVTASRSGSQIITGNIESQYIDNNYLQVNGDLVLGGLQNPDVFSNYFYGTSSGTFSPPTDEGVNNLTFFSPFNVELLPGQTINFTPAIFIKDNSASAQYNMSAACRITFSDGSYHQLNTNEIGRKYYSNADIVTIDLNTSGVPVGVDVVEHGELVILYCNFTNNTDSSLLISSFNVSLSSLYTYNGWNVLGFRYGFISTPSDTIVNLPSYVEDNLINISNKLASQDEHLKSILREFDEVQLQLQALIDSESSGNSIITNYYQSILEPTTEQLIKQEELTAAVEAAKEELEELKEIIETAVMPDSDELSSLTSSSSSQEIIASSLNNEVFNDAFSLFFSYDFIVNMLFCSLTFATLGFILFGKRG